MALKVAIVQSRLRKSRIVAQRAGIGEVRLSCIVTGRLVATEKEKDALARVLRADRDAIFPPTPDAVSA